MVPGRAREAGAGGVGCRQLKTPHVGRDPDPGPVVGDSVAGGRHSSWALASDVRVQCLCLSLSSQHQTPFPLVRPCSPVPVLSVPHRAPSRAAGAPSGGGGTASRGSQGRMRPVPSWNRLTGNRMQNAQKIHVTGTLTPVPWTLGTRSRPGAAGVVKRLRKLQASVGRRHLP